MFRFTCAVAGSISILALASGCGSSSSASSSAGGASGTAAQAANGSPLAADARSAATGDIPDNQVFLVFRNSKAGYSLKYPEGWTQSGSGSEVTFRAKNNLVRIAVAHGHALSIAAVRAQLLALQRQNRTLSFRPPQTVTLGTRPAIKVVYSTQSAPNAVTGKRVTLLVDRYVIAAPGRVATVDLGTPRGVDNVDAYRMMIESFRWQ